MLALLDNICYTDAMIDSSLTFGEYLKRLRRSRKYSLHMLADRTKLSYTHVSRLENDSTIPKADTVARLADALDGDIKVMLELANCLPRTILDRIISQQESGSAPLKRRALPQDGRAAKADPMQVLTTVLAAQSDSLDEQEAIAVASAVISLTHLEPQRRAAIIALITSLASELPNDDG